MKNRTALVLGATGGIGGEVATRLLEAGWWVRGLNRDPAGARGDPRIAWINIADGLCDNYHYPSVLAAIQSGAQKRR